MKDTFTIAEIRKYILSQDSLGDVLYNLSAENIIKANEPEAEESNERFEKEDFDKLYGSEIDDYFHCDRCGANLSEACNCGELEGDEK